MKRLPHFGWWLLLAVLPMMLLAVILPLGLDHYRVQQIIAASDPESAFSPLKCEARGPEWLWKTADRLGCEKWLKFLQTRVTIVHFMGENFGDEHLRQLPNTVEIEGIALARTRITDAALASLGQLPRLQSLSLQETEVGAGASLILRNCPGLKQLTLIRCPLADDAFLGMTAHPDLEIVRLESLSLSSRDCQFLSSSPNLTSLNLRGTLVDDEIVPLLTRLPRFEKINLSISHVGDPTAIELSRHSDLLAIDLSETAITDLGAKALATMPRLVELHLSGTSITDQGTTEFDQFRRLQTLILSRTAISDVTLRRVLSLPIPIACDFSGTKITDSGLDALTDQTLPARLIGIADTAITDEAVARVTRIHPKWVFVRERINASVGY